MGYYDDQEGARRRQKGNRSSFLAGLVGSVIGAMLVIVTVPQFADIGTETGTNVETGEREGTNDVGVTENVSVNVTTDVTEAVEKVRDAVVGVINLRETNFWEGSTSEAGAGSGVIYKKDGNHAFIVTNHHVVERASDLEVTLSNGERVSAQLIGTDPLMDLAVLEIDGNYVEKVAEFGHSDTLKPGEPAIAIGNPLGFLEGTVTEGIISNTERTIPVDIDGDGQPDWNAEVLQTDASINPGNSGGALINIAGQVIGINSSKIAQAAVEGIGFAIPIDTAKPIINDLEQFGEVRRPFIGLQLQDLTEVPAYHVQETLKLPDEVEEGVVVMGVVPNSPAHIAGLEELDVITALDGEAITNLLEFRKYLYNEKNIGEDIRVTYYRAGEKEEITVQLTRQQTY